MDAFSQLILALVAVVSNAVTTRWGFSSTQKMVRREMLNKLDVVTYAAKVKELHDLRNADRERAVALEAEVKVLRDLLHELLSKRSQP